MLGDYGRFWKASGEAKVDFGGGEKDGFVMLGMLLVLAREVL